MDPDSYKNRIEAVKEITSLFKLERFVYIGIIIICLCVLIICIVISLIKGEIGVIEVSSMMGSGGTITIMTGRLLHMWNKTMQFLENSPEKAG